MKELFFEQETCQKIIKLWLKQLPKRGRGELSKLAEYLGVNSTLVSQVMSGSKDFTLEQGFQVTKFFGFDEIHSEYFLALLQHSRAGTHDFKKYWKQKIIQLRGEALNLKNRIKQDKTLSDFEKATYYSSYIYSALRIATSLSGGQSLQDLSEIVALSREKTADYLSFLVGIGLIRLVDGKYQMEDKVVFIDRDSPLVKKHHLNWRLQTLQRLEDIDNHELCFTYPHSASKEDSLKIREILLQAINDIQKLVKDSPAEKVSFMNIDLFDL